MSVISILLGWVIGFFTGLVLFALLRRGDKCRGTDEQHDWTPTFTDRNSPQSFEDGKYRGFRYVGKRCQKCGEHETWIKPE